jgi:FimV-like protein
MGDNDGAKPLLEEVLSEGDDEQVSEANELIGNIR